VKPTYSITTEDYALFERLCQIANTPVTNSPPVQATAAPVRGEAPPAPGPVQVTAAPPVQVTAAPVAPPAPVPVAPPAPVPVASPPAARGEAPPGWTIQHIQGVLQQLATNPAKGGPQAVMNILQHFGVTTVRDIDPARWPEVYQMATA
jgi:hypothetical protein